MNFSATFNDLNPGKLIVNTSLFAFVVLFALKLDKSLSMGIRSDKIVAVTIIVYF